MDPAPYNPLDRINLARSVELTLLQQPCGQLPLKEFLNGAGIYALYYHGTFAPYRRIASDDCRVPIYVGKAVPAGSRRGLVDISAAVGPVLCNRISEHAESIEAARNLKIQDFSVRYLVVEDIFIAMGEALMIQQFRPLWNVVVSGFGLHEPGRGRHGSKRSDWDELHPGRPWHAKMTKVRSATEIKTRIKDAFNNGETATNEQLPDAGPSLTDGIEEYVET